LTPETLRRKVATLGRGEAISRQPIGTLFRKDKPHRKKMKTESSIAKTTKPNTVAGSLRTACAARLLPLLLSLTLPAAVQAQFLFTTDSGTITITSYYGSGGAVTIPSTIDGRPVTSIGGSAFGWCSSWNSVSEYRFNALAQSNIVCSYKGASYNE
jgi:hypothetical protein